MKRSTIRLARRRLLGILAGLAVLVPAVRAGAPLFSHMTLNDLGALAVSIEDVERDLAVYGFTAERVRALVEGTLRDAGLTVVDQATAIGMPSASLFRVRIITNRDGQGFYHLSVKCEVRRKIPLGNPAQGFVSQPVWTDARNGVMLASEVEKIEPLVRDVLAGFVAEFRVQNP
ncbi:MAG: hypothetical protein AB7O21_07690 [Gammaproteobacteria bacterium]